MVTWATTKEFLAWFAIVATTIKAIEYLFSKTPVAKLQEEVNMLKQYVDNDNKLLKEHEQELKELRRAMIKMSEELTEQSKHLNIAINKLGTAQIAVFNHMITGNGIDDLKQERDEMIDFFIKRKDNC